MGDLNFFLQQIKREVEQKRGAPKKDAVAGKEGRSEKRGGVWTTELAMVFFMNSRPLNKGLVPLS